MTPSEHSDATAPPIRPVVVAVAADGSFAAVRRGASLAVRAHQPLHLLHVVELVTAGSLPDRHDPDQADSPGGRVLSRAVVMARVLVGGAVHVESELAHGDVVGRIVAAAQGATCVVLEQPPPAAGGGHAVTCSLVASHAPVAVVCVPRAWGEISELRSVTVGIKDPFTCRPLLREAVAAATDAGVGLQILHAGSRAEHAEAREFIEGLIGTIADSAGSVVTLLDEPPLQALRAAARHSSLLVVGRHRPPRGASPTLGPVARALVRRSYCPVLVPTSHHSVSSADWVFLTDLA